MVHLGNAEACVSLCALLPAAQDVQFILPSPWSPLWPHFDWTLVQSLSRIKRPLNSFATWAAFLNCRTAEKTPGADRRFLSPWTSAQHQPCAPATTEKASTSLHSHTDCFCLYLHIQLRLLGLAYIFIPDFLASSYIFIPDFLALQPVVIGFFSDTGLQLLSNM